jgi:membrane protein DedA with SNARE-associated domain
MTALESFLSQWGYLAVTLGVIVEGEATLLAAGALAHRGVLSLPGVCVAAFVGTVAADQFWFLIGRRFGGAFLAKRPRLAARSELVQRWLARYGGAFVASVRFLYGLRTASVIWLGASGFSARRFTRLDCLGAVLWSAVIGATGWGVGVTLTALLGRAGRLQELLVAAVLVTLVVWLVVRARERG